MKLLMFLGFNQYELARKYKIIVYRIAFSNSWCSNRQSGKIET